MEQFTKLTTKLTTKLAELFEREKADLDWLLDRYQVKIDKKSGIKNAPNDWCTVHNNPHYILDLLQSVAHVSTQTNTIVATLPALNERTS